MAPSPYTGSYLYGSPTSTEAGLVARRELLVAREQEADARLRAAEALNAELAEREAALRQEADAREARLREREASLKEQEEAVNTLAEVVNSLKADLEAQPAAPEVARTPKRRPRQRGRLIVLARSISPRKRAASPRKRKNKLSHASTTASSSCASPTRPGRRSKESEFSSEFSVKTCHEEPLPTYSTAVQEYEPRGGGLLSSFPIPLPMTSWDWPLSRDEKKSLVLMFDRQELMVQRDEFAEHLTKLRCELLEIGKEA